MTTRKTSRPRPARTTAKPKQDAPMEHPAVLVVRIPTSNGGAQISVVEMNGFDPLAVPLFLRMAADAKESLIKRSNNE